MTDTVLLWLRQDLRLHDQPALVAAAKVGAVVPVYVLDDDAAGDWRMGSAQRWWLHQTLLSFDAALKGLGSRLILRRGESVATLRQLLEETGAHQVHAIRHYEPWWRAAERELGASLCLHDGNHLVSLDEMTTGGGTPFRVYSAFWSALAKRMPPDAPLPAPNKLPAPEHWPASDPLDSWNLLPKLSWAKAFAERWTPGEGDAQRAAQEMAGKMDDYAVDRNLPAQEGTSRLSPHLHFGEISPATLWHLLGEGPESTTFRKELAWRDFTSGVIRAMPDYADRNGRAKFDAIEWRTGDAAKADLVAWQKGRTGYPIVDAGMRQLWTTGWMHNRVRMITASFLIKHLLIDWRDGERWFWDTLVDADYGNNSVNWQWVAGTGVDANMWGRIMAPLLQSEKFDAGDYIRKWVPELRELSDRVIHDPDVAGCRPDTYPLKIIGHREARERALAAGRAMR